MSMSDFVISLALLFLAVYLIYTTFMLAKGEPIKSLPYCVAVCFVAAMIGLVGFASIYRGIVQ